jgi:RimJ/RimL family protein N-acetyltransferase
MVGTMRWQIRPWTEADTDGLHRLVRSSLKELSEWLPWCHESYSRRDTEAWIAHCHDSWATGTEFPWGVFEATTGEPVGGVGINKIDASARSANLGYWTGTPWLGLGVARAAAMQAADFAFLELRIERLDIVIHPQNLPSRRVAEAIGARLTGIVPQRLAFRGAWVDAAVYELRRSL